MRNVIFDFGGVLIRWRPQEVIEGFYQDEDLRRRLREAVFEHPDWIEMDRGTLSDPDAAERFAARMGRPAGEMHELLEYVKHWLAPMEETLDLVRALAERGIALYGLSNMSAATFAHLKKRVPIWGLFRGIVISAHIGLVKPDPRIFTHISEAYRLIPADTAFIDDLAPNVEAAARHGFRGIRFESAAQCRADLEGWLGAG